MVKILLIDNYDSFTYNIKHYFEILGYPIDVIKNDAGLLKNLAQLDYTHIILSPGPGSPADAGLTFDAISTIYKKLPILGICLGHQCLAQFFGARITHAENVMHGKISVMHNNRDSIFANLPSSFKIVRYHSLIVDPLSLPSCLKIIAWTEDPQKKRKEIMAIRHQKYNIFGVQYHPEAIMTEHGLDVFNNFIVTTMAQQTHVN